MREIAELPKNGLNVISTFSGCGGSSLGYKLAGFRVLWANEFIPEAQKTYLANHGDTILSTRDIRTVTADEIRRACNLSVGELDLFDGSPPCASFSTAGKREKAWGQVKRYSDKVQRTDDLFFEYVRLIRALQPRVFIAENVSGLVKGTAKGYFLEILAALRSCGYVVTARLLDAQWLGVPQMRQRLFFVGVRNDLRKTPVFPAPFRYRYTLRDAFVGLPKIKAVPVVGSQFKLGEHEAPDISRFSIGKLYDETPSGGAHPRRFNLTRPRMDMPAFTLTATGGNPGAASIVHPTEKRKFSISELRRLSSFPDDFVLTGCYMQQWERLGRSVPPLMMKALAETIRDKILL